jgi:hypothetical protein
VTLSDISGNSPSYSSSGLFVFLTSRFGRVDVLNYEFIFSEAFFSLLLSYALSVSGFSIDSASASVEHGVRMLELLAVGLIFSA